jgi:hypothetical protein
MLVSPQEKVYLYLKSISLRVLIKLVQKGIVLRIFQQGLPVNPLGKLDCQACLAHPQGAFNDNMVVWNAYFESPLYFRYFIEVFRKGRKIRRFIYSPGQQFLASGDAFVKKGLAYV